MSKPSLIAHRKSWDLKSAVSCGNPPSPVKPKSTGGADDGGCTVDSDSDSEGAESYVESLERQLKCQEAQCRALARERCELTAQLQDSVEYIRDLESELLRFQSPPDVATEAELVEGDELEGKGESEQREAAQQAQLCSELADENDQLREQIARLMRELQDLAAQRDLAAQAVPNATASCQTKCSVLKDAATQAVDNVAETEAAAAAAAAAALKLKLCEVERERQTIQKRVEDLVRQISDSDNRCKKLESELQSSLTASKMARDEADRLRHQLTADQAREESNRQQAVSKAVSEERHRHNLELESHSSQLMCRIAGLESQLTACRELLKWSGANADRDWQRVKAELSLVREASEASAGTDELLRQLADREERLLRLEARLQSQPPPQQQPPQPPPPPPPPQKSNRRHLLLLGSRRRKQTNEQAQLPTTKDADKDIGVVEQSATPQLAADRVAETLALMEAKINESQALIRLIGALKVDCESWKRRCRTLEATIASSGRAGLSHSCGVKDASTVLLHSSTASLADETGQKVQPVQSVLAHSQRDQLSMKTSLMLPTSLSLSRNLAAVGRCRSVNVANPAEDFPSGPADLLYQTQQQKQQPAQQQLIRRSARRCLSSLGIHLRRNGAAVLETGND